MVVESQYEVPGSQIGLEGLETQESYEIVAYRAA